MELLPLFAISWYLCLSTIIQTSLGQNVNQQNCETMDGTGVTEYRACLADAEPLYNLNIMSSVEPENYTCGYGQNINENLFCTLDLSSRCSLCDAFNETLSHPPHYTYDQPVNSAPTWWQSITWYNYPTPLEVNLTLSLNHSYTLNSEIRITFQSSLPRRMVLEKSSDYGVTWQPYQFYADDCGYFGMTPALAPTTPTEIICSEEYSSGSQSVLYSGGVVLFSTVDRLALLTNSNPLPQDFQQAYENATDLKAFLEVTDLRLRLLYPATDGLEWTHQLASLVQYYYAVSSIDTFVICNCNLHAKFCFQDRDIETVCQCRHNTIGKNCQLCLPLYNNRPWQPGSALPYPEGTANECEKCNCNDHSDSCNYNETFGRGVCDNCRDNTAGLSCEICVGGYYRNISVEANDPESCMVCNCHPLGTEENDTMCSQYPVEDNPVGQCNCRANVEGPACDVCVDQFYGLLLDNETGICKECNCNLLGTVNASNVCEKEAGTCPCKIGTDTRTCGECKDLYYGYPTTEDEDCSACSCDIGGAISPICNKVSGRCECRQNITDRQCSVTEQGFYFEFLDSNSYDAWEAISDCVRTSTVPFDLFTGRGFQTCYQGNRVTFSGATAVTQLADSASFYRPVIRYTYTSDISWQQANLDIRVAQSSTINATAPCPLPANTHIMTLVISFLPGRGTAWVATEGEAVMLDRRCQYDSTLTLSNRGAGAPEIEIDSLVLMPVPTSFSVFSQADPSRQNHYATCLTNMTAVTTRQFAIDQCQDFMFSMSAERNDGALECDCDPIGTIGSLCNSYGGACVCKSGVGGRRCDRCLPGFFGFASDGCTACNCDATGALSLACDYDTGQCPCKVGVALYGQPNDVGNTAERQCRACLADHYGFSTGGGCVACNCNVNGSQNLQCSETGVCPCKETIVGQQCDKCLPGYFAFSASGCTQCNCNTAGSTENSCHPNHGTCTCKPNVQGIKCDMCSPVHFNLQPANLNGCQPCFCYGHGNQSCNHAPGYVASVISDDFRTGYNVERWTSTHPAALTPAPGGLQITHLQALAPTTFVYLQAPTSYLGKHLELYSQQLTYTMKLNSGNIDQRSNQFLIVTGGRNNMAVYYTAEVFVPTLSERQYVATFYETNWRVVGEERTPTVTEFQEILSDVRSIQIRASFGPNTISTFYEVAMYTAVLATNLQGSTNFVTTVEQCTCDGATNTMGLSCEQCQPGTFRQNAVDTPFDPCVPCRCNGRANTCHSVTGVCQDCQPGTQGDHCESCADNVQEPLCNRCLPDYYGFGTELFGGACSPCNCNMTGTGDVTQCDMQNGQCPCTGNYGGMRCDSCQFSFYNYAAGCLRCDVCYDGISTEYADLLLRSDNLTKFVGTLRAADTSSTLGPFYDRLMATYNQMLQLVERTNAVLNEGDSLLNSVTTLNTTMHQLLASLAGSINSSTEMTQRSLASAENLTQQALGVIVAVEQTLSQSYAGLTSGDIQLTQSTLDQLRTDLASVHTQLNAVSASFSAQDTLVSQEVDSLAQLAERTVGTAETALTTAQRAQAIHDNTTSRTAALVTKANEVTALGRRTEQAVSEVNLRAEQAKTTEEGNTQAELLARIAELMTSVDPLIEAAKTSANQAAMVEKQAGARQTANANIISEVANAGTQTEILVAEANATIADADARYNRALAANQSASQAVASSEGTFAAAEEMLRVVQSFESQSRDAKGTADESLLKQPDIQTLSTEISTKAMELRGQLTGIAADATEGLTKANLALQRAETEGKSVDSVNEKAVQLASESTTNLRVDNQTMDSIRAINVTQLQPAKTQCNAYSPGVQTLENTVTQANADSQTATDQALAAQETIQSLLTEISNIRQVDLADLSGLQERIRQARAVFTQRDFEQLITFLSQNVQEQQTWLDATKQQVGDLQAQITALESFRVP